MFRADPHPLLVPPDFRLADAASLPPEGATAKDWKARLEREKKALGDWQHKLYANGRYSMLLIFQALDAGGKDGTIRRVFSGVNPTGLHVTSFKRPSEAELAHDFLWRTSKHLPERGHIAIFNRSYYEEVLVVRVHPQLLKAQRLPEQDSAAIWNERYRSIVEHEHHLANQGTVILKFWLNISKDEQHRRFLSRIEELEKHWKFDLNDLNERAHWDAYLHAYEQCLRATSHPWAPWYAIPADDKPYMRWQVAALINGAFEKLGVGYPEPDQEARRELLRAAARLARD
jgi:PPK2 family polyphosphate:nucleotide phosphotransferase